jgi:hypothetical protein
MEVAVTLRTYLEFEDLDDINDIQDIVMGEMAPDEILEMAYAQGNVVNIDVG